MLGETENQARIVAYLSLNYHVVFSTKYRRPWIAGSWRPRLHEYLGGTIRRLGGAPLGQGGIEDHVHLLFGLRATHRLCDTVREIKKASTKWVHDEIKTESFLWQGSYAAFSVDYRGIAKVQRYIANQEDHHRQEESLPEIVRLLANEGVEYDPRFLE